MNVMITMLSTQTVNDESNRTELVTEGSFSLSGDTASIRYEDSEATGFEGSVTEISVTGTRLASIIRTGSASSNLMIETGKKHYCHYAMPFGEMTIGVYTHTIKNGLTPEGGSLYFKYTIDMNGSYLSDNEIQLTVEKQI